MARCSSARSAHAVTRSARTQRAQVQNLRTQRKQRHALRSAHCGTQTRRPYTVHSARTDSACSGAHTKQAHGKDLWSSRNANRPVRVGPTSTRSAISSLARSTLAVSESVDWPVWPRSALTATKVMTQNSTDTQWVKRESMVRVIRDTEGTRRATLLLWGSNPQPRISLIEFPRVVDSAINRDGDRLIPRATRRWLCRRDQDHHE